MTSPERSEIRMAMLRKLARRTLNAAGVKVGGDHLVDPIADLVASQCEELRKRVGFMVGAHVERGDRLVPKGKKGAIGDLADLGYALEHHYVTENGVITVAVLDEAEEE